jgi:hypothetical protein
VINSATGATGTVRSSLSYSHHRHPQPYQLRRHGTAGGPVSEHRQRLMSGTPRRPAVVASQMQNFPNNIFQEASSLTDIQDPTLVGFPFPTITSYAGITSYSPIQHNWDNPYTEAWNFDLQQGIGRNGRLDVAYVGNHDVHLDNEQDINRFFPGTSLRPYPNLGSVSLLNTGAFGNYDALQVSFTRRFTHGLQLNASYTWSEDSNAILHRRVPWGNRRAHADGLVARHS